MKIRRWILAACAACSLALATLVGTALAHHASAPFYDPDDRVELQGTVTRWVFRNPHAFLYLDVDGPDGATEWQVELGAPVSLRRVGWTPDSLAIGMEVRVSGQRSRAEGSFGICCVRMTRSDGSPILEGGRVEEANGGR